jgi:hypothetical protein
MTAENSFARGRGLGLRPAWAHVPSGPSLNHRCRTKKMPVGTLLRGLRTEVPFYLQSLGPSRASLTFAYNPRASLTFSTVCTCVRAARAGKLFFSSVRLEQCFKPLMP